MLLRLRQNALVRQAISYTPGTTIYKLQFVLLVPLFVYAFDAEETGRLELALFGAGLVSAVASANLNTVVSQRYTQSDRDERPLELGLGVVTSLSVAAGGLVVALVLSGIFIASVDELSGRDGLIVLAMVGGVFNALVANLCLFFQLKSAPRAFNVTYTVWAVIVVVGTAAYLAAVAVSADSYALATLAAGLVCTVIALWWFRDELALVIHHAHRGAKVRHAMSLDLRRAARLLPLIILGWALLFLDRKFLSAAAGVGEVGVYGLAIRIANVVTIVLAPLQAAWWDASMNLEPAESSVALRRAVRAHAFVMLAGVLLAVLVAQGPLPSLLGDWFGPGVRYIPVLIVCATLISTYVLPYALLTRSGNYAAILIAYGSAVAVNIVGNLALDGRYGAAGASIANFSAYVCLNAVALWPVRHEVARALGPARRSVAAMMLAAAAIALAALLFPSLLLTGY